MNSGPHDPPAVEPAAPDPAFETMAAPARASGTLGPADVDPFETMARPPAAAPSGASVAVAPPPAPQRDGGAYAVRALLVAAALGTLVAVALGVYGRLHEPQPAALNVVGFSGPGEVKSWLTTVAFVLGVVQLGTSLVMWGRIPQIAGAPWIDSLHRWSGRVAVVVTVPVAVHCLYVLGFLYDTPRALVHSLLGCLFYGVFVTKMLLLGRDDPVPGWLMPVVGGVVFSALTGLWLTSSVWFFTTNGIRF